MGFNKFFQELKKRRLYKVALTYGAVSWLLLQIASVALSSFNAPNWVMKAFIILVILGFPIAMILTWAYEQTPEGFVKSKSSNSSFSKKKIFSNNLVIVLLVLALIGQFLYNNYWSAKNIVDSSRKSIAVLPFINDSTNDENLFFCNGIMENILDHLAKIPELTVISRTSVEQYRNNKPSLKKIAEELEVNYIVEGSVQRINNQAVIFAQLIYAEKDQHLWSHRYQEELVDVFAVQANIAESIAEKLETIISPEIKDRINSEPTNNLEAYDYFLNGQEFKIQYFKEDLEANYNNAVFNYQKAIEIDSTLAEAYSELALMHWLDLNFVRDKIVNTNFFQIADLCNKAITLNPKLPLAHALLGQYKLTVNNDYEGFKIDQLKAIELNPNFSLAYYFLSSWHYDHRLNYEYRLKNIFKAISLDPKSVWTSRYYSRLINIYFEINAFDLADVYAKKLIEANPNQIGWQVLTYLRQKKYQEAESLVKATYAEESKEYARGLAEIEVNYHKNYKKALLLYARLYKDNPNVGHKDHRYGLAFWLAGDTINGKKYFNDALIEFQSKKDFNRGFDNCYDVAGIYAILGDIDKSLDLLENSSCFIGNGLEYYAPHDAYFKDLWDNPRFKEIIQKRIDDKTKIREEILRNEIN